MQVRAPRARSARALGDLGLRVIDWGEGFEIAATGAGLSDIITPIFRVIHSRGSGRSLTFLPRTGTWVSGFGTSSAPIWLEDLMCRGDELDLRQCARLTAAAVGDTNCGHDEDVVCREREREFLMDNLLVRILSLLLSLSLSLTSSLPLAFLLSISP